MRDQVEEELKPLAISCTSTDCMNGLHCFLQKKRKGESSRRGGPCRECGADLVEWARVTARKPSDTDYTFQVLQHELIRHELFHRPIDQKALNHAKRKGRVMMEDAVEHRIRSSIGKAYNPREGRQTPFNGNVIYYAQHAVAACCRKCAEYWHGIASGRDLAEDEVSYLKQLILRYIDHRLPSLNKTPQHVPSIKTRKYGQRS